MNIDYRLFVILIPLFIVYLVSYFTNSFRQNKIIGSNVSFRPPPIVFAIVWPILLILLGISWYLSFYTSNNNFTISSIYIVLILLLSIWTLLYKYSKIVAFIDIIICFLLCLSLVIWQSKSNLSKYLLLPLLLWLIFAGVLNIADIKSK